MFVDRSVERAKQQTRITELSANAAFLKSMRSYWLAGIAFLCAAVGMHLNKGTSGFVSAFMFGVGATVIFLAWHFGQEEKAMGEEISILKETMPRDIDTEEVI